MTHGKLPMAAIAALLLTTAPAFAQSASDSAQGDKKAPAAEKKAETKKEEAKAPAPTADTVMVTVNGEPITLGEIIAMRRNLPQQYQRLPDPMLMRALVEQMANQQALAVAAEKAGVGQLRLVKALMKTQRRAVLADVYLRNEVRKRLTEEAIKTAYDKRYANAKPVVEIRASHILVKTEEKAKELKKQIDGGAKFADVAAKNSTGPTKTRGGDLGWFSKKRMVPAFGEAAYKLKKGEVSAPVKTRFGWHVIHKTDQRTMPVPELKQVRAALAKQLGEAIRNQIVDAARKNAKIGRTATKVPPASIRNDKLLEQ